MGDLSAENRKTNGDLGFNSRWCGKAEVQVQLDQTVNKECPELFEEILVLLVLVIKMKKRKEGQNLLNR